MRTLATSVLLGLLIAPAPAAAQSADFDIPAHVSRVDGRALIERAYDTPGRAGDVLERNVTLTEGDRIRTLAGRVEVLFADGTLLHLDRHTILDFQTDDFVRLMAGRARWIVSRGARTALRVDTPSATLELDPGGDYRVAVAPNGDAELAVLRGAGAILNDQGETALRSGERAVAATGRAPSQAFYANAASWDDFDRWSDDARRAHASAISAHYLPDELRPYGAVFDAYGSWRAHPSYGSVWYPVAASGWQPYSHGRWHSYPRYGWTWIGRDPWAWPTHHFGRWGFSSGVWFWIPGRSWGPAWVAWATSRDYVGWSPLGYDDHPIYRLNVYDNYSAGYPWCGWTFIRERHFGGYIQPGQTVIGAGVSVIARSGILPAARSPIQGRALPRHGVPSGTAVPRGTAIARPGDGSPEGGLAGVPAARPGRVPPGTIRRGGAGTGDTRRAPVARAPGDTPRTARPRGGSDTPAPGDAPNTAPQATPAPPAARPVRRPSGGGSDVAPRAQPRMPGGSSSYPYSAAAPRARDREQPAAAPEAVAPRATAPRDTWREPSRPAPAARVHEGAVRSRAPDRASEAPRAPARRAEPRPESRPAPTPGAGAAGSRVQPRKRGGN